MHNSEKYISSGFTNILDNIESILVITDEDFLIEFVSNYALKVFATDNGHIVGKNFSDIFKLDFQHNLEESPSIEIYKITTLTTQKSYKGKVQRAILDGRNLVIIEFKESSNSSNLDIYKNIFDNAFEGIFIFDKNGNIKEANPAACKIYGISREELLTLTVHSIFPHNTYEKSQIIWQGFIQNGSIKGLYKYLTKLGEYRYIEFRGNAFFLPEYHLAVFNDITERIRIEKSYKQAEIERDNYTANLLISEKKFRNLAENSPDLIYIIDISCKKVVYFNRSELLGYPSSFLENSEAWLEIVYPDDVKKVKKHWRNFLLTAKETRSLEYRLRRNNGEYEWVVNRHTIIERDEKGHALHILLNITIITEQKKAQEALLESEARLTSLIENSNDLIWSTDRDFYFTAMNSAFKNLFMVNFRKKLKVGDNLLECLPSTIKDEWYKLHLKALEGERLTKEFSGFSSTEKLFYEISYNPIYSDESSISGVSVFARDVTLRKLSEENIIRANFELDSFVYRASHDLRAPLRSVLGLVNIIKEEESAEKRDYYFGLIEKSISKLDFFIADLINFSRNSRLDVVSDKINFRTILSDCIDNLRYMENASVINIIEDINDEIEFYSDESRISIIFQNLLSNSFKYINTKASNHFIKITIVTSKKGASITFEDNGKGIDKEYHDKIFQMFFRASHDSYGSGLGLYITKQVIEKLKGSIVVKSKPSEGTTFKINLYNFIP